MRIKTSKLKATDTRGERVKATSEETGEWVIVGWDYSLDTLAMYALAATRVHGNKVRKVADRATGYIFETEA